jgi:hypothetical protein
VMEFIQFKLDVNEQTDCTSFNRLNDTDVTTGNHILKVRSIPSRSVSTHAWLTLVATTVHVPVRSTRRLNAGSKRDRYRGHQCLCQRLHDYLPV